VDIEELLAKADAGLTAGRSFGPVIEHGGTLVIPAAVVFALGKVAVDLRRRRRSRGRRGDDG
jgi:hypothetical protein